MITLIFRTKNRNDIQMTTDIDTSNEFIQTLEWYIMVDEDGYIVKEWRCVKTD